MGGGIVYLCDLCAFVVNKFQPQRHDGHKGGTKPISLTSGESFSFTVHGY
jgi:hypothetical protein